MARRGRERGLDLEAEYWHLPAAGVGPARLTEPLGTRCALPELGARAPVVPLLPACLRGTAADDTPGWPSAHFAEIVNDLAGHARGSLCSELQWVDADRSYGVYGVGLDWDLRGPRGPCTGSMRSRRSVPGPCWQPLKPRATTSSSPHLNHHADLYPKR